MNICKYCGEILNTNIDVNGFFSTTVVDKCNCKDVLKIKEINKKIEDLEKTFPVAKYELRFTPEIVKIKKGE